MNNRQTVWEQLLQITRNPEVGNTHKHTKAHTLCSTVDFYWQQPKTKKGQLWQRGRKCNNGHTKGPRHRLNNRFQRKNQSGGLKMSRSTITHLFLPSLNNLTRWVQQPVGFSRMCTEFPQNVLHFSCDDHSNISYIITFKADRSGPRVTFTIQSCFTEQNTSLKCTD